MPRSDKPLNVVVGTAIAPQPSEDVDAFHARYVSHVVALYDRHKASFGASSSLEVW